jgi:hypothetical protein
MGLYVEYLCANTTMMGNQITPHFDIVNGSSSSVPLSSLELRYYFTANGSTSLAFDCDYAKVGCPNLSGSFNTASGMNADHYLSITFSAGAGDVAPGSDSGEIQARFHDSNFAVTFNQADDYSFDATKTSFSDWDHVTLYQSGTLVWGVEP